MRTHALRLCLLVVGAVGLCTVAQGAMLMEPGVDRPGQDLRPGFELPSADPGLCMTACQDDAACQAFTYVKPGVQGPRARCWLKGGVPPAVKNECCVSGVRSVDAHAESPARVTTIQPLPPPGATTDRRVEVVKVTGAHQASIRPRAYEGFEIGFDRPGADYRDFDMDDPRPDLCRTACESELKCRAFTFVRGGLSPGPKAHCWLKTSAPVPVRNEATVSGLPRLPVARVAGPAMRSAAAGIVSPPTMAKKDKGPKMQFAPEQQAVIDRMNAVMVQGPELFAANLGKVNAELKAQQQQTFLQSVERAEIVRKNPAMLREIMVDPQMSLTHINGMTGAAARLLTEPSVATLAPRPSVAQVLSVSSQERAGTIDTGGYVFITGRNFGSEPRPIRLVYSMTKEFAPNETFTLQLSPMFDTWEQSWSDTLIAVRIPVLDTPASDKTNEGMRYMLTHDPSPRLVLGTVDVPVQVVQRYLGFSYIAAFPAFADREHVAAMVPGGKLLIAGQEFRASQGKGRVWVVLPDPVTDFGGTVHSQINLDVITWSDTLIEVAVPGDVQGDYPFVGAMLNVENDLGWRASSGMVFGPRMQMSLQGGAKYFELDKEDDADVAVEQGPVLWVKHDPGCGLKGNSGDDWFFNTKRLSSNATVDRVWITWQRPDDTLLVMQTLKHELSDWLAGRYYEKIIEYTIVVLNALFGGNPGSFVMQPDKAATAESPWRMKVHWENSCFATYSGVPIVYTSTFQIWAPEGTIEE